MPAFIARRLSAACGTLLASTFLVYCLVAASGDPLAPLYADRSPDRALRIAQRTELLQLDEPLPVRYLGWLAGAAGCVLPALTCDLGRNVQGQEVVELVRQALAASARLVLVAVVLSVVLGVAVGVVSALRRNSRFDHVSTFAAFLFFSLPSFWVAVLLKQYLAIEFNDWLAAPRIPLPVVLGLGAVSAATWAMLLVPATDPHRRARRSRVAVVALVATVALLQYLSAVEWFRRPGLGPVAVAGLALGSALAVAAVLGGLRGGPRRRVVLPAALASAGLGAGAQFMPALEDPTWLLLAGLGVLAVVIGALVGVALSHAGASGAGGAYREEAAAAGAITAVLSGLWIVTDRVLSAVPDYSRLVNGRLVATIGSGTPNLTGDFWLRFLDQATHLLLPTLVIMLVSFATYSRFTRAGMLDVLAQDHVRAARARGLGEPAVVVRHAVRNALVPVATLVAIDVGAVIGGAVVTENVFGWQGMGTLFVTGLRLPDPNPVMAFYLVTAVTILLFSTLADIVYALLDPRVRL